MMFEVDVKAEAEALLHSTGDPANSVVASIQTTLTLTSLPRSL
jgi:hypothetical protein